MPKSTPKSGTRERVPYRCADCGWETAKWVGRCGECQAWGTVEEVRGARLRAVAPGPATTAKRLVSVDVMAAQARPTGVPELDRVLGGGLVPGAVVLVAGEPGVGKSTLLLDVASRFAEPGESSLVVTGEESAAQVRLRAGRIGALAPDLYVAAETDLGALLGHVDEVKPSLVVVDSIQTIEAAEVDGVPGGMTQVREVAGALSQVAKERGIAVVLVGHVTKDGAIAGPRVLEHLVDVVLHFDGDRHARLRMVRAVKNRFGPTDEVGCFDLSEGGIVGLPDPSALFVTRHRHPVPGTCVTVALEGRRPLVAEVQALVAETVFGTGRRATSGLDTSRVSMVLAVLEKRGGIALAKQDVYAATVGGVRMTEPASDLAIALSVASAAHDVALASDLVAVGEVGLAGEVRPVSGLERRLAEAARLGFTQALVPVRPGHVPEGIEVVEIEDVPSLLAAVRRS